ncbi:F-box protein At1g49360 [Ziziphus jujuba]|uniref:F-box protein At1g49360 n=2 Tax=Ziziphus jujuba TaxID=326968 RepID=A0A6P4A7B7_ZIZJJ|nr:F-box protein At1g49360 [Ziziphus jujuba]KAH7517133.1 hypothetical protein FEM48_Zijuj09G0029900 [Ziziphus jujuba var. spinosa]
MGDLLQSQEPQPQPPLLFLLGELSGETKHGLVDPIDNTFNSIDFPELESQSECLSSNFGWLLILSRETSSLFFFNPITRHRIDLPFWNHLFAVAAFSAPPTSPDCSVFAVEMPKYSCRLRIDTLNVGQKAWTRHGYFNNIKTTFTGVVEAAYSKGCLYCVDMRGRVGIFDGKHGSWKVVPCKGFQKVQVPYLVEFNGEIYAAKKGAYGEVEKLERLIMDDNRAVWKEVKDLGDVDVYLGPYGSCFLPLHGENMEKKFFIANLRPKSMYPISTVDLDDCICKKSSISVPESYGCYYTPVWIQRQNP